MSYQEIHKRCLQLKCDEKALGAARFFKTGKGEYGEGDVFYGINVPTSKAIGKEFKNLNLSEIEKLFKSKIHEERLIGIFILRLQYEAAVKDGDLNRQKFIYSKYFTWRKGVNNWDLVDSSAPYFSGHFYYTVDDKDLLRLMNSKDLWERRIAVISCFYYIRQGDYKTPLKVIESRLYDKEDLMHKACGWMLREIGKRDIKALKGFLKSHAGLMPRTALRYAIEKMDHLERKKWMGIKKI